MMIRAIYICIALAVTITVAEARRVALVIGNSAYQKCHTTNQPAQRRR